MSGLALLLRRDTFANWNSINPILADGEMGIEKGSGQYKIGNGITRWIDLPYGGIAGGKGEKGDQGDQGLKGDQGDVGPAVSSMPWSLVTDKPTVYPPAPHTHDGGGGASPNTLVFNGGTATTFGNGGASFNCGGAA